MSVPDATATAALVRAGQLSASEAVADAVARAEQLNPALNAIVETAYDRAVELAAAHDGADGPLAGVPVVLKDLFCPVEGDPAYQGNRVLRAIDHRYSHTGNVAGRLLAAGAVSLGRSHSPELGGGNCPATSETAAYGPTRNPWDTTRSPLGSSGGAAAAVAAGIVPLAHASDGGGSIRLPASACGLVGLKPSRGRISLAPAGEMWSGGATDGVVSLTVRDTALGLDVLAGPEPGDPTPLPPRTGSWCDELTVDPGRLRIVICDEVPFVGSAVECGDAVRSAGRLLESLGHIVEPGRPPAMATNDYMYDYVRVIRTSLAVTLDGLVDVIGRPWRPDDVEAGTWINYERGRRIGAVDLVASRERLHRFTRDMVSWWEATADLLLTPTVGTVPPPLGHLVDGDERDLVRRLAEITPFVTPFNVTGQPAVSLPLHWTDDGIPIGVQLVAAPQREDVLLRVAAQLETAAPWADRTPPPATPEVRGVVP